MKKIYTIAAAILMTASVWAQSPEKMSYQAVVRDASNNLTTNQVVGMQISILQGSATGNAVYVETQTPTTNANGLVSLEIGTGTVVSGDFTTIDWANGTYFIKTETDPTGGTSYTITGTTQLMSVPYALHAKTAKSITGTVNYTETDPVFGASIANGITAADTANWNNHTIDTDTQLDSTGVAALGFVAGPHTIDTDTQLDSTGVASLGFVAGLHTIDTDTQLDSTGVASLGYVAGAHTDSTAIANMGFVAGGGSGSVDPFYLGQDTLGGIVYYIYKDATGTQHGLIVNKTESTAVWQASATFTNALRSEDGIYNTAQMTSSAAKTYVTSIGAGWYLPSIDELAILYYNRFTTNKALRLGGFTLLSSSASYWSSMEYPTNATTYASILNFINGGAGSTLKSNTLYVRAIRAF